MADKEKVPNMTIEQLTKEVVQLKKDQIERDENIAKMVSTLNNQSNYINQLLNYVEELDAVTFVALYLWTGRMKKTTIGNISHRRLAEANALRINGRRALGEHQEKERLKKVKEEADELGVYYDEDTSPEELDKRVQSARAVKESEALEEAKKKAEEGNASTDKS